MATFDCNFQKAPPEAIAHWREKGFCILRNLINLKDYQEAEKAMIHFFPDDMPPTFDFGTNTEFPTCSAIDKVTLNLELIQTAKECLRVPEIRLAQSVAWPKKSLESSSSTSSSSTTNPKEHDSNNDQRIHCDYGNHTFLHPAEWEEPEVVAAIVYFSDCRVTGGGTAVAPRLSKDDPLYKEPLISMPGYAGHPFINDRQHAEEYFLKNGFTEIASLRQQLYAREIKAEFQAGDVLLYRHDVWHRGTPMKPGQLRRVLNLTWKKAFLDYIYCWGPGFAIKNYQGVVEGMVKGLSPEQRNVLGIPLPGDSYWTERSLRNFESRYPGIDVSEYREKLVKK